MGTIPENEKPYFLIPKYVIAKVSGIATWETLTVDLHKGWRTEFPVWAVGYETFVPLLVKVVSLVGINHPFRLEHLDRIFVIICIRLQERHIVFRKSFRPRSTLTHDSLFAYWFPQKLSYALSQSVGRRSRLCRVALASLTKEEGCLPARKGDAQGVCKGARGTHRVGSQPGLCSFRLFGNNTRSRTGGRLKAKTKNNRKIYHQRIYFLMIYFISEEHFMVL